MKKPLILITNDDGVYAPGIKALVNIASCFGEVVVVAPSKAQSGMGHAITLNATLRLNKKNVFGNNILTFSCTGTPVDCVKLAVNEVLDRKPDLLLSGINHGSNSSVNVLYSGTMSAAVEGAMENIPSIGLSLLDHSLDADFTASQTISKKIINTVLKHPFPERICLNVNIPNLKEDELMGIKICRQALGNWEEEFEKRTDPMGKEYYWLTGVYKCFDKANDTDIWALENNYVSVVPVQFDMTAHNKLTTINTIFNNA